MDTATATTDRDALVRAIETLERQRHILGDGAIDLALGPLRARLATVDGGATVAAPILERQSERKVVTVLFADLVGFSAMSERLNSEEVAEIVNALFDRLVPALEQYGGTIDKFMGDEVMAVFGAPQTDEHHVDHALRAALGMFNALATYNRDRAMALGLHVGINTGSVIAGEVAPLRGVTIPSRRHRQRRIETAGCCAVRANTRRPIDVPSCQHHIRIRCSRGTLPQGKSKPCAGLPTDRPQAAEHARDS
jgi:class 3 adenylate cyclase